MNQQCHNSTPNGDGEDLFSLASTFVISVIFDVIDFSWEKWGNGLIKLIICECCENYINVIILY